jgi:hypothetical protein
MKMIRERLVSHDEYDEWTSCIALRIPDNHVMRPRAVRGGKCSATFGMIVRSLIHMRSRVINQSERVAKIQSENVEARRAEVLADKALLNVTDKLHWLRAERSPEMRHVGMRWMIDEDMLASLTQEEVARILAVEIEHCGAKLLHELFPKCINSPARYASEALKRQFLWETDPCIYPMLEYVAPGSDPIAQYPSSLPPDVQRYAREMHGLLNRMVRWFDDEGRFALGTSIDFPMFFETPRGTVSIEFEMYPNRMAIHNRIKQLKEK